MRCQAARHRRRLGLPLALSLVCLVAARSPAADDIVVEETPPQAPPHQPMFRVMPPQVRVEMRQIEVSDAAGPAGRGTARKPYLGIVTEPVSEQVRAQLELPEGMGLAVEAVADDGPAGRGGIERFDVLRKFDDQLVCTAEQLSALVKAAGKGKEVTLTVVRGGKEMTFEVLIDEHEVAVGGPAPGGAGPFAGLPAMPMDLQELVGDVLPDFGGDVRARVQQQVQGAIQQAEAGGFGGNGAARVLQVFPDGMSRNMVVVADERGTVEIREADGKRTVTVKDPSGEQVHKGPLDTEADRERVPEAFRGMVEEVEGRLGGRHRPPAGGELDGNEL